MSELRAKLANQRKLSESGIDVDSKVQSHKAAKQEPKQESELQRKLGKQRQRVEKKTVAESELQGLIFDCDGTLVDTMPVYYESWCRLCEKYSLQLTEEEFYSFAGLPQHLLFPFI